MTRTTKAGTTKRVAKAVAALAATGLVRKAVRKAAEDPRVRRKAAELGKAAGKKARTVGKRAAKKTTALARTAGKKVEKRVVAPARKKAGRKIQRLGKALAG